MSVIQNGQSVKIMANDFIQSDILAYVRDTSDFEQKILLELDPSVTTAGVTYDYAVISPRLARDKVDSLLSGRLVGCAVTWVPAGRFDPKNPFDISWWRGGGAAISDVTLA